MTDLCNQGIHDWETGSFGVIVGVSRCKRCGVLSTVEHFEKPHPTEPDRPEGECPHCEDGYVKTDDMARDGTHAYRQCEECEGKGYIVGTAGYTSGCIDCNGTGRIHGTPQGKENK